MTRIEPCREFGSHEVGKHADMVLAASRSTETAQIKAEALQAMARRFRVAAALAWGGPAQWLTTGDNVAELAALWCEDAAADHLGSEL